LHQNRFNNNSLTQNFLSISISPEEVREIEAVADPIRSKVHEMFSSYRPELGNGSKNGEPKVVVPIEAEIVQRPIERKAGDEQKTEFWNLFVSSSRDRPVEGGTAEFVVRTIISETIGAHRCGKIEFNEEPITVGDCLDVIERLVGVGSAAGWQRVLAKASVHRGPGA
jgi:hypothetical protein